MSSKDQIIKNNAVEIDKTPKRLTFFKDFPPLADEPEDGYDPEASEGAYRNAYAENYGSGAYGAKAYAAEVPGETQAGTVPVPAHEWRESSGDAVLVSDGQGAAAGQAGAVPGQSAPRRAGAAPERSGRENLMAEAREQAEAILREARTRAEEIVGGARQQEETMREDIRASLLEEELPQALEEGREQGRQEGRQEWDEAVGGVQKYYESLERLWHDELAKVDEELLELALKISERMVGTVLKYDKEKLLSMIRTIILLPNERRNLKIHVSDADWEWLRSLQDKGLPPYPLIRDEGLQPGNVLIQSGEGIFDAQLETQLDKFREVLSEELINGQLESLS